MSGKRQCRWSFRPQHAALEEHVVELCKQPSNLDVDWSDVQLGELMLIKQSSSHLKS